jgi:hypothetical protein
MYVAGPNGQVTLAVPANPQADAAKAGAIAGAEQWARVGPAIAIDQAQIRPVSPGQTLTSGLTIGTPGNGVPAPGASGVAGGTAPTPVNAANAPGSYVPGNFAKMVDDAHAKDQADVAADTEKTKAGNGIYGTTATIRSMLPNVTTGQFAEPKLLMAQWASALGMSPEAVQKYVGTDTPGGELLQKKLFELSTGAVRGMGAREPGSVIAMFNKNYPNLSSRGPTIEAMTRLLDMDQRRQADYTEGKQQALSDARNQYGQTGQYNGLVGFDNKFNQSNSPVVYQGAALAAAKMPYSVWSKGLSPQQQAQAMQMASSHWNDVTGFFGPPENDGKPERFHTPGGR